MITTPDIQELNDLNQWLQEVPYDVIRYELYNAKFLYQGYEPKDDPTLTAAVRSRQLHIYRNGKKILVLAGKAAPKIIREDSICEMVK